MTHSSKVSYEDVLDIKVPIPPVREQDRAVETDVSLDCDRIGHSQALMRQHLLTVNNLATPVCHCNGLETIEFSARATLARVDRPIDTPGH
jgi:hypothetical protein